MNLNGRLDRIEERTAARQLRATAEGFALDLGCTTETLVAHAEHVADLIEQHGRDRTIEIVADRCGQTPEQLEASAERWAAKIS